MGDERDRILHCAEVASFLGNRRLQIGDYVRAEALFLESLDLTRLAVGDRTQLYHERLRRLGDLLSLRADPRAIPVLTDAAERCKTLGGDKTIDYAIILSSLTDAHLAHGQYSEAAATEGRSLSIRKALSSNLPACETASLCRLARISILQHHFLKAKEYLERAEGMIDRVEDNDFERATVQRLYGDLYMETGDYKAAEAYLEKALPTAETVIRNATLIVGKNTPTYAEWELDLVRCYCKQGKQDLAAPLAAHALKVAEDCLEPGNPAVATALVRNAEVFVEKKDYQKAETLVKKARGIRDRSLDASHPERIEALQLLSAILRAEGKTVEAQEVADIAANARRPRP